MAPRLALCWDGMDFIDDHILGVLLAVGLGLLVGLQREWVPGKPLGVRSFALISATGGILGILAADFGGWLIAAGLLAITGAILVHSWLLAREEAVGGMTTELAGMTMFLVGVLATSGHTALAVVLGGGVTLLLYFKNPLHTLVAHIEANEFAAIARFVLLSMVVLPVLPDRAFG
ncbi:MAG: MgtC/SapB family protein, partial [Gammaproteobacteria bacterium]